MKNLLHARITEESEEYVRIPRQRDPKQAERRRAEKAKTLALAVARAERGR